MKRRLLLVMILSVMFVMAGCGGGSDRSSPPPNKPDEYVKVTYDGNEYTFRNGLSTEDGTAIGAKVPDRNITYIVGTISPIADMSEVPSVSGVRIRFAGSAVDTYTQIQVSISVILNGESIVMDPASFSLSVTKYEAVGGELSGTFSGTVPPGDSGGDPKPITCTFKVIRSADGAIEEEVD